VSSKNASPPPVGRGRRWRVPTPSSGWIGRHRPLLRTRHRDAHDHRNRDDREPVPSLFVEGDLAGRMNCEQDVVPVGPGNRRA
jgi:hypothetical protein